MHATRLAVAALLVLAGCGETADAPAPTRTTAATTPAHTATATPARTATATPARGTQSKALSVAREFSRCARDNGQTDFPDPAVVEGQVTWPDLDKEAMAAVDAPCGKILARMPPAPPPGPPTALQMRQMRQLSRCLRAGAMPDFPDPNPDGTFSISGTPYDWHTHEWPAEVQATWDECFHIQTNWRVTVR
jgi:hypothetical protein